MMRLHRREKRQEFTRGPTETAEQEMKALRTRLPVLKANLAKQNQETNSSQEHYCLLAPGGNRPQRRVMEVKERYGRKAALVIEESGISFGLIQSLREKNINVVEYKPKGDKQERLISQIDLFEGGSVLLPKDAHWLEEFVAELLSFPGRHDDQVDALAQGLAWRREQWKPPLVQRRTIGMGG